MTEFNDTALIINNQPTTYGELRQFTEETFDDLPSAVADGFFTAEVAAVVHGMLNVIEHLIDKVEELSSADRVEGDTEDES